VNAYGKGLTSWEGLAQPDFPALLKLINDNVPGLERLRFTTSHPRFADLRMIDALTNLEKVCEQYHLPLQAGSDKILKMMNRGYTTAQYLDLLKRIRGAVPECAVTSDVMVGFPGETEDDFLETLNVVKLARFDAAFTFVYSARKGTKAADMDAQVPDDVKKDRIGRLLELQSATSLEVNTGLKGHELEVMSEGPSDRNPSMQAGRSRTNKMVHWPDDGTVVRGDIVHVRIDRARTFVLHGTKI
jgi:tRNA-2-methylthio-N6-dimethylallyladenosine synthase